MDAIPFTQFMMPSGRRVPVSIVRPAVAVDKMIQDATSYFAKLKRTKERLNGAANS
jgi:hypothetical protein